MVFSIIFLSTVQAGNLQGGAVVSAQESWMFGGEVRFDPPSPVSFYGRGLLGEASIEELDILKIIVESDGSGQTVTSDVNWRRLRIELGAMWAAWDRSLLGNGGFLNLGVEAIRGSFPGREQQLSEFEVTADIESSYWVQPIIEFGAAVEVPLFVRFEIKQSLGYSFPVWATGYVFSSRNGEYLSDLNAEYDSELNHSSFSSPYLETVTTMTGEMGLSWLSLRTRIRSYSSSEFVQVLKAYSGDEEAKNLIEIMPEFVIGVGF